MNNSPLSASEYAHLLAALDSWIDEREAYLDSFRSYPGFKDTSRVERELEELYALYDKLEAVLASLVTPSSSEPKENTDDPSRRHDSGP